MGETPLVVPDTNVLVSAIGWRRPEREVYWRGRSFVQTVAAADPLYRWRSGADVVDVMPIDPFVLGFTNPWYEEAIRTSVHRELEEGLVIRLPTPVVFYTTDCQSCHVPARESDWIYTRGYPLLNR